MQPTRQNLIHFILSFNPKPGCFVVFINLFASAEIVDMFYTCINFTNILDQTPTYFKFAIPGCNVFEYTLIHFTLHYCLMYMHY